MDPLLPINKVLSLVSQEEHQRKIGTSLVSDGFNSSAFAVKSDSSKRMDSNGGSSSYSNGMLCALINVLVTLKNTGPH